MGELGLLMNKYNQPPKTIIPPAEIPPAPYTVSPASLYGWQCPLCGAVYSPFVTKCENWHGTIVASSTNGTGGVVRINRFESTDAEEYKR